MSKKVLSVALALCLVFSCFAVSAFAIGGTDYEDEGATYTQAWELATPVQDATDSTKWTVDVKLTADYSVGAIQFTVENTNNEGAVLTGVAAGSAIPAEWIADVNFLNETGKVIINANPTSDAVYAFDASAGVVVATLTYTVAENATATINIKNDPKTATTPGGTLIAARMSDGNVVTGTAIVGQTVTSVGNSQNLGAKKTTPPTLQAIAGTIGVVDTSRTDLNSNEGTTCDGYIYGLEPFNYETVDAVFEVVGDGTMNIVANDYGSEAGTGTMVQVLDLDGNVVAEYVLVVFGDVDGDGEVTVLDASEVELHAGYVYPDNYGMSRFNYDYQAFAACVDGCGDASTLDASEIELSAGFIYPDDLGNGYLAQETIIDLL